MNSVAAIERQQLPPDGVKQRQDELHGIFSNLKMLIEQRSV
jgi:hypothetical protein